MPFSGRNLIIRVGGNLKAGENIKGYLRRIAAETGIGFRSLERAWRLSDGYQSKKTKQKLEWVAEEKTTDHVRQLIEETTGQILIWEELDPELYRAHIDAARKYIVQLREYSLINASVPSGKEHDPGG